MTRTRVRQETIDKIAKMGMARSLKHAHETDDAEFREAVKRYYPKAQFGPKTAAAAQAQHGNVKEDDPDWNPATMGNKKSGPRTAAPRTSFSTPSFMNKRVTGAVARRVEPPVGKTVSRYGAKSQRNNLAGRKQGKGVIDSIVERHRSLDKQFKRTNPKVKKAIAGFFTGDNKTEKEKRRKAAQRPRS